jgi:hypothetical protein
MTCGTTGSKSRTKKVTAVATNGGTCSVANITGTVSDTNTTGCNLFSCDRIQIKGYYNDTGNFINTTTMTIPSNDITKLRITLVGAGGGSCNPTLPDHNYGMVYGGKAGSVQNYTITLNTTARTYNVSIGRGGFLKEKGDDTILTYNGTQYKATGGAPGANGLDTNLNPLKSQIAFFPGWEGILPASTYYKIDGLNGEGISDVGITSSGGIGGKYGNPQGNNSSPDNIESTQADWGDGLGIGAGGGGIGVVWTGVERSDGIDLTSDPRSGYTRGGPGSGGNGIAYVTYLSSLE